MLNITICDDDKDDLKRIRDEVFLWSSESSVPVNISCFQKPGDLSENLTENGPSDIYILDVLMPKINGIELGHIIRSIDKTGRIIYLTSTKDFAVDSYEVEATYYCLKPIDKARLFPLLTKINDKNKIADISICIHTKDGDVMLRTAEIDYVESSMRFPHYITESGRYTGLMLRGSFGNEMKKLLESPCFYMCGASFLVNLSHIRSIEKNTALFFSGNSIALPRTSVSGLRRAWSDYFLEKD